MGTGQASGSNVDAPKKNHLYALCSKSEQKTSPYVVTGMLNVFSIDVYVLLDQGDTLLFDRTLESQKFDILPVILNEPFSLSTQWWNQLFQRVYRNLPIMLANRVTHVE